MLSVLRVVLGPVLLFQGARVRRTVLRLPEADGPRSGGTDGPRVLILGDSSAAGVGVETQDQALSGRLFEALGGGMRWRVLATTGWTTADALDALRATDPGPFDAAVILLGVNDVTTETGIAEWLATYCEILDLLRSRHGVRRAYLSGMPPMGRFPALPWPLRWYMGRQADAHDRALADMAAGRDDALRIGVESDLPSSAAAVDGFHPGPLVYAELGRRFAAAIRTDAAAGVFD